jgi:hypothetical protein
MIETAPASGQALPRAPGHQQSQSQSQLQSQLHHQQSLSPSQSQRTVPPSQQQLQDGGSADHHRSNSAPRARRDTGDSANSLGDHLDDFDDTVSQKQRPPRDLSWMSPAGSGGGGAAASSSASSSSSSARRKALHDRFSYDVGSRLYTLSDIEHAVLRAPGARSAVRSNRGILNRMGRFQGMVAGKFGKSERSTGTGRYALRNPEPRINFALVTGTLSTPATIRVFSERALDDELEAAAREAVANGAVRIIPQKRTIMLPRLLQWYGSDFGPTKLAVATAVSRWLPDAERALVAGLVGSDPGGVKITYDEYEWGMRDWLGLAGSAAVGEVCVFFFFDFDFFVFCFLIFFFLTFFFFFLPLSTSSRRRRPRLWHLPAGGEAPTAVGRRFRMTRNPTINEQQQN